MQPENLNVFDLDGTIIRVNSFRAVNKKLLVMLIRKLEMRALITLAGWYILRKCRAIPHLRFKQRAVGIFEQKLSEQEKQAICQAVFDNNVNELVLDKMTSLSNCIISTASPSAYVSRMRLPNNILVISALSSGTNLPDPANWGPGKLENLKARFQARELRIVNFYTDSEIDDQALIELSENTFIVQGEDLVKIK